MMRSAACLCVAAVQLFLFNASSLLICTHTPAMPSSKRNTLLTFHDKIKARAIPRTSHRQRTSSSTFLMTQQDDNSFLTHLLEKYSYDSRIVRLSRADLPVLVEVQDEGMTKVCQIVEIIERDDSSNCSSGPPKFRIQFTDNKSDNSGKTVDVGQITTLWQHDDGSMIKSWNRSLCDSSTSISEKLLLNAPKVHELLERLYKSRVGQGRSSNSAPLSKKQINKMSSQAPSDMDPQLVAQILRQILKTGPNFARLIDSSCVLQGKATSSSLSSSMQQRFLLAHLLGDTLFNGGRFKRWPCLWLPGTTEHVTLVNGGWLVLDQCVRASLEGQMFAEQQQQQNLLDQDNEMIQNGPTETLFVRTKINQETEQRIIHRLECLAMGEETAGNDKKLEVDVHATLRAMDLPLTSDGARTALLQMGRWSTENSSKRISPWSRSIMQAADWYKDFSRQRRSDLFEDSKKKRQQRNGKIVGEELEGRVDLSSLPCLCVDAAKASFRDDAIGVRPRASTGRKVNPEASKWEILLHIADVSDIYVTSGNQELGDPNGFLAQLRSAAASRGSSRYDLPRGPLHMLPTDVLESMSLETFKPDWTSGEPLEKQLQHSSAPTVNRCVTVWVYIDERSGRILDAGLERTLISRPVALSFQTATALLEGQSPISTRGSRNSEGIGKEDPMLSKIKNVLKLVERYTALWSEQRQSNSKSAQDREERLASYEEMSRQVYGSHTNRRDDGREGFQRSPAHRLVDSSMNLYSDVLNNLVQKAGGTLPRVIGASDGRAGTGPLRRYIDGIIQMQALSILCSYGGKPLSRQECAEVGRQSTDTLNRVANSDASRQGRNSKSIFSNKVISRRQQQAAVRILKLQVKNLKESRPLFAAMSTGKGSEVLLMDVGAVARCRGIQGTLRPGTKVQVWIESIDEQSGTILSVLDQ
ncbi:RNB domain containing protein [Nitzschia inconspicua]|uniref:RNB domain containing protein n=1 Tax=Nitzschia inconspicua TaxID=303405 RepID=A0A9K3PUE8_9STRA|nr:RNB domain containing protein [Nitzschia inconspicua]